MRKNVFVLWGNILLVLGACTAAQAPSEPEYKPTATIKDIMNSMIDPNADVVWEAVASYVTESGIEERAPRNDEEWARVRNSAITLLEASNLLLTPGRRVAEPGAKPEDSQIELTPEEIETLINQDRQSWMELAHGLHDSVLPALNAIDNKNAEELLYSSDVIDTACENCHEKYWYPNAGR